MLLSVVVPVYNVEAYLPECVECLLDQGDFEYEIVLVNDGSTDGSLSIAESYAARYKNIVLHSQENMGASAARNAGASLARGEFVYFVDADDYIERKSLGKVVNFAREHNLDFCGFGSTRTRERGAALPQDWTCIEREPEVMSGTRLIGRHSYNNGPWWYVFRRSLMLRHDIFFKPKARGVEDGLFTAELLIRSKRAALLPVSLYYYYISGDSVTTTDDAVRRRILRDGMDFAARDFTRLLGMAREHGADDDAITQLRTRQESYVFFLAVRVVNSPALLRAARWVYQMLKR
ncbi:MAG: glycosyltransferase [Synergistaceae bacterium]|jgi:glycosyltransferase involved in cell wall biosynthesis|nr:glycosyltransferase [Synergistaceae bacterium]